MPKYLEWKLVLAARLDDGQDHEVRMRKEPLPGFGAGCWGGARERSEVLVPRKPAQVFNANAGQVGDLVLGEELLARLDSNHTGASRVWRHFHQLNRCLEGLQ